MWSASAVRGRRFCVRSDRRALPSPSGSPSACRKSGQRAITLASSIGLIPWPRGGTLNASRSFLPLAQQLVELHAEDEHEDGAVDVGAEDEEGGEETDPGLEVRDRRHPDAEDERERIHATTIAIEPALAQ